MAIKTLAKSGGADYTNFVAAIAGMTAGDILHIIEGGIYSEAAALALNKSLEFINMTEDETIVQQPVGAANGVVSGGTLGNPLTIQWGVTGGPITFEIRKGGANTEYNWLLGGDAAADNHLIFGHCKFKSNYTTGNTQAIYQQAGKSHTFIDCETDGQYETLVRLASTGVTSIIDGLTITGSLEYVVVGSAGTGVSLLDTWSWRRLSGQVTKCPIINTNASTMIRTGISGLFTTSTLWGLTATPTFGPGTVAIEKSVFHGSGTYAFLLSATGAAGLTFRNVGFLGFTSGGVEIPGIPVADTIDYCGIGEGCPALSNAAGALGTHNKTTDPLLIDATNHNYRPLSTSPWRNAGVACVATVDPDGNAIPQETVPDIGAYEYVNPVTPVTYTGYGRQGNPDVVIATDLQGQPLEGFDVYDLLPALGDPLVNLVQIALTCLFSDRRANADDALPGGQTDRRGWVGDTRSRKVGSRLWQLEGRPVNADTAKQAQQFADECLQPLVTDSIATKTESAAELVPVVKQPGQYRIELSVRIEKQDGTGVIVRFPDIWGI